MIYLFIAFTFYIHDVTIANYEISQESNFLSLEIKIDKDDFEEALNLDQKRIHKKRIQKYLDKESHWYFNDQKVHFKVASFSNNDLYYHIKCQGKFNENIINKIQVKNTILHQQVEGHSNIIHFNLNQKMRMFRMHEGREVINLNY